MIGELPLSEWMKLDPVFAEEFDLCIPDCRYTQIVAERNGEEVKGFVAVESVKLVQALYVFPQYRKELRIPYRLLDCVETAAAKDRRPLYAVTDVPSVEKFMARRGAKRIEVGVYRKGVADG